jgi:hypothetical protein
MSNMANFWDTTSVDEINTTFDKEIESKGSYYRYLEAQVKREVICGNPSIYFSSRIERECVEAKLFETRAKLIAHVTTRGKSTDIDNLGKSGVIVKGFE